MLSFAASAVLPWRVTMRFTAKHAVQFTVFRAVGLFLELGATPHSSFTFLEQCGVVMVTNWATALSQPESARERRDVEGREVSAFYYRAGVFT